VIENQTDRHLSWERFESLVAAGPPAVERVPGVPKVEIFTDPAGSRVGIRLFSDAPAPSVPLAEMITRTTVIEGQRAIEVSTDNSALYREFYAFACAVADGAQISGLPPSQAVEAAISSWVALVEKLAILSPERQTGLLGELWTLDRLASSQGWHVALGAWKGPYGEEHDFSLELADIEVKTTVSDRRVHMIGSLTQLLPTVGRPLYVLSLEFTRAGAGPGQTLTEAVAATSASVARDEPSLVTELRARLTLSGWNDDHAPYYRPRWQQRAAAHLVAVDGSCPAIVPATLASLGAERLARVMQLSYRVDLEGLGSPDGSTAFLNLLPEGK
jgi:hypothetical protein